MARRGRLVLLVDPDLGFVEDARARLADQRILSARSLDEAVEIAVGGRVDVALLGPSFGNETGVRSASELLAADPTLSVVLAANVITNRILRAALTTGLSDVIDTPITARKLSESLAGAGRRAPVPIVLEPEPAAEPLPDTRVVDPEVQVSLEPMAAEPVPQPAAEPAWSEPRLPVPEPQPVYLEPAPVVPEPVPVVPDPQVYAASAPQPEPVAPDPLLVFPEPAPEGLPPVPQADAPFTPPEPGAAPPAFAPALPCQPLPEAPVWDEPAARYAADPRPAGSGGRVIAVMAGKGGSGKTIAATNLAIALTFELGEDAVAIVDADLQFGDVALLLQLDPDRTVADAASGVEDLTDAGLDAMLLRHDSGLRVLPAPLTPMGTGRISPKALVRVIEQLRGLYRVVVVDTGPVFDDALLTLLDHADEVLVVVDMDLPSVKNAKVALDLLRGGGYPEDRLSLAVNRVDSKARLDLVEMERSLGLRAAASIPSDRLIPQSVNEGVPVVALSPRSKAARAFRNLASLFLPAI